MKKVKVYSYAFNRPDFISLQLRSLAKFLLDEYEYIVFNNAMIEADSLKIAEVCGQLGIRCIDVKESNHKDICTSHTSALQWSFHKYIKTEGNIIAVIIDHDIFMVKEFSINNYLHDYDVAAIPQGRGHVYYLWPGIMFFNMETLPNKDCINFMWDDIDGIHVDSGGNLYYWLKNTPELRIRHIIGEDICSKNNNLYLLPNEIGKEYVDEYYFGIIEKAFLHYARGANWNNENAGFQNNKTILLKKYLKSVEM